jgi:hypothetical protein
MFLSIPKYDGIAAFVECHGDFMANKNPNKKEQPL